MNPRTSAATGSPSAGRWTPASTLKGLKVVGFEACKGGIEHFPARHDDDIESGGELVPSEEFARKAFGAAAVG